MTGSYTCPRCRAAVRAPGWWSDAWTCADHGEIAPVHPPLVASDEVLRQAGARSQVPLWLPWPLPVGWVVTGVQLAGDEHTGPVAAALACSGPNPLAVEPGDSLSADLLLVAEQPVTGWGAGLSGLQELDPGRLVDLDAPHLQVTAAGHELPLWPVDAPGDGSGPGSAADVGVYAGEAAGVWLWAICWPAVASSVLLDGFTLVDLRDPDQAHEIPYGALSPRLS